MLPFFPFLCSGRPILPHRPANNGKREGGPAPGRSPRASLTAVLRVDRVSLEQVSS